MPRQPRKVPTAHGAALKPAAALRELGCGGRVLRALGGDANMHWLVGGVHEPGSAGNKGDGRDRAVLRRYGP